jgi:hypothetical protein
MTARTVEVQQRTADAGRSGSPPDPVILRLLEERLTVESLIRRTVEEQLRDLTLAPNLDAWAARQTLDRWYPADTAAEATACDSVRTPPSPQTDVLRFFTHTYAGRLDPAAETERALRAFAAGSFFILVNGRQVERLDEEIGFAADCTVTFLRVTPLVGG